MKGSTNVRQAQKITRRAGQLKVLAWTAIIVNAIVTCLPGVCDHRQRHPPLPLPPMCAHCHAAPWMTSPEQAQEEP